MRPQHELADVIEKVSDRLPLLGLNSWQMRTLYALRVCRTRELGGHIDVCTDCGMLSMSYNSCRNRHCPKCQGSEREKWIGARQADLLPVRYFHVVFTLPQKINRICLHSPVKVYDLLFQTAWSVMSQFGEDKTHLGAKVGMIAVLHTWGQNLSLHPHLHCIVPSGGVTKHGKWKGARNKGKFLFPTYAMGSVFRARFVSGLRKHFPDEPKEFFNSLFDKPWVIHTEVPFRGPETVIEYLGRYTHKIAISNHRIKSITDTGVTFSWKDYSDGSKQKLMTLDPMEFIRRFCLHILPKRYVKIRHYGILSSTWKRGKLQGLQQSMGAIRADPQTGNPTHLICPHCKKPTRVILVQFDARGPPPQYRSLFTSLTSKT